jgi:hypothetical protein
MLAAGVRLGPASLRRAARACAARPAALAQPQRGPPRQSGLAELGLELLLPQQQQRRGLATREGKEEHGPVADDSTFRNVLWTDMSPLEKAKYAVSHYGLIALVGGGVTYAVSKGSMWMTSTFMGLSFKTVGWWGFMAGYGSGFATAGALYGASRSFSIRPETVRSQAFQIVQGSPQVQQAMGLSITAPLRSGIMRAYSLDGGVSVGGLTDGRAG